MIMPKPEKTLASLFVLCLVACSPHYSQRNPADMIITDAAIYTGNPAASWAEAVAIKKGRLIYVGSRAGVTRYVGDDTKTLHLDGRMVMPGIVDAHLHPIWGMLAELYQCQFAFSATPNEVQQTVAQCVEQFSDQQWIQGGQWDSGFFDRFVLESPKQFLDAVSKDKAVYLKDDSGHNAWVNSKALELAGIDRDIPDPPGGVIVRDRNGEPNGVLLETGAKLFHDVLPKNTDDEIDAAANAFAGYAHRYGITGIKPAAIRERHIAALQRVDLAGMLNLHVATAIRTQEGLRHTPLDYDDLERIRDRYRSENVDTRFIKIFLDGVPTTARTAGMLSPYTPEAPDGPTTDGGPLLVSRDALVNDITELDKRGFTVKIHTAGDRSVRVALDAIEAARNRNSNKTLRHELAHAGYISNDDMPRFAALNAVPDFSPVLWHPSPIIDNVIVAVGKPRGEYYWPVKSLLKTGANVLVGSDWPSAVPDANPWVGIEAFVTRREPRKNGDKALWENESISLEQAIAIYTVHGARAIRQENEIGTLEIGKLADLIVLNQNLFEIPIESVSDTQVLKTFFAGKLVYDANQ